jgi:hypothetical protein
MSVHPFAKSHNRLAIAKIEFDFFKSLATPATIQKHCNAIARFEPLATAYSFYIDDKDSDRLQLWFAKRSMFRKDDRGAVVVEDGPALVYSLGPTGHVAIALYPAKSGLARVTEDHLYLDIGSFSGFQLSERLPRDIADLVAYGHVTSLDGNPTLLEKLRIGWLRWTRPTQLDGKYASAAVRRTMYRLVEFLTRMVGAAIFSALFRPWGIVIALLIATWFGWSHIAALLIPK